MRYRILGTTQALRPDGTPLPLGGARLRALLAVFALRPGRTVPAALLVDEVWAGDPPADAPGALQALVGRLRRVVGPDAVESVDGGYRLAAVADDVDLHRFERLAGEGLRALADGDPGKAAAVLDDALALWQGPALADLPDRTAQAARWEIRRLDVRRARLTAALALGEAEAALPELAALCDEHPLDEPLQALRLRALRATGRPAQALAAYEAVRELLADRLGSDPGPELRSLHAELLDPGEAADSPVDLPADSPGDLPGSAYAGAALHLRPGSGSAAPSPGLPSSGATTAEAPHGDPRTETPASRTEPSTPHPQGTPRPQGNLRARLTSFVGRAGDIGTISGDLSAARLVTLLGPGGAGKTRLSQETGDAVAAAMPDGVWFAELAPVDEPAAVPEVVLTAVGARETVLRGAGAEEMRAVADPKGDPLLRLAEHCARRRMLLILDNCEHLVDAAAHLAEELLARCPGVTILATSREPLGVPGELLRPVEPLPQPYALRLLADRGGAARPGFRVEDDPEAAAEICRRLDGLPLAIELAAARLRILTLRQIADRLDDRFRLLTSGSRTVLPRQQTLRAVVDWSWDLLETDERAVLRRLSVFAGGCDLPAAEAVCGPAALESLGSLVDKSLVVAAPDDAGMRYRLLETVAEYAGERLDESGERAAAERDHLTYYREVARTTDPLLRGHGQRAAIARLQREYENIRTALRRAVAARDEQEALMLVLSLCWYWQMHDLRVEARTWSVAVMPLGPDPFVPPARPVPDVLERFTDRPPPFGPELLAEARRSLHIVHLSCMDLEAASWETPQAREKMQVIRETYRPGQPQTCRAPGFLWFFAVLMTGDLAAVHQVIDETVGACRELGYTWELGQILQLRANVLANRSNSAHEALVDADEALRLFTDLGDDWGIAESLSARGEARERFGEYVTAAADYEAAGEYADRLGARHQKAVLQARLGSVLIDDGQGERGERVLRAVIEESRGTVVDAMPAARLFLATWLGRSGRVPEAREQLRLLREDFGAVNFMTFDGFVVGVEAFLDQQEGRYEEALVKLREALARAMDRMTMALAPHLIPVHLNVAALTLASLDDGRRAADAARCLGAADALLSPGHVSAAAERETRERAERRARAVLDDAAYDAAYAQGGGLSMKEAAALL